MALFMYDTLQIRRFERENTLKLSKIKNIVILINGVIEKNPQSPLFNSAFTHVHFVCRYMAEILPIRRKTLVNLSTSKESTVRFSDAK